MHQSQRMELTVMVVISSYEEDVNKYLLDRNNNGFWGVNAAVQIWRNVSVVWQ